MCFDDQRSFATIQRVGLHKDCGVLADDLSRIRAKRDTGEKKKTSTLLQRTKQHIAARKDNCTQCRGSAGQRRARMGQNGRVLAYLSQECRRVNGQFASTGGPRDSPVLGVLLLGDGTCEQNGDALAGGPSALVRLQECAGVRHLGWVKFTRAPLTAITSSNGY